MIVCRFFAKVTIYHTETDGQGNAGSIFL